MPFYSEISTDSRARVALSPGSYGTGSTPGLKIVQYIDKSSKPDKSGAMRHSFLVAATKPSREQDAEFKKVNGNGPVFVDGPDYEGTAFFSITLHEKWLNPESIALAFSEASKNKDGVIQVDYVAKAIASGDVTEDSISNARAYYANLAAEKVEAANTPAEQRDAAIIAQYGKELTQVAIKVGTFFRLQDAHFKESMSQKRDLNFDVKQLVGTEFSGKVEKSNVGDASEVTAVYSYKPKS